MGIKYFRPKGRGIKPQEIIKQSRIVNNQSTSTISAENNLKPTVTENKYNEILKPHH